jgi:hypothetical protein
MSAKAMYPGRFSRRSGLVSVAIAAAVVALAASALAGCSTSGLSAQAAEVGPPSVRTPLSTSAPTADGTWATIPMGHLDQPLDTFWQLFFRPSGARRWSDQVKATATATNGGLVLAAGRLSLIVGIRPSELLTFTPLIATSDGARSWSDGLVAEGLAARPDALAAGPDGQALALVNGRANTGSQVLATAGDLSTWQDLTSQRSLAARPPGLSCGLGPLTAVGYLAGHALVGGSCAHPGVVGMFALRGGAWHLVGPALPPSVAGGRAEVLALAAVKSHAAALIAVIRGHETELLATWSGPGPAWATSAPLPVREDEQVVSFGPAAGDNDGSTFVLLHEPSGRDQLMVATGPRKAWKVLPSPPPGTATVAFGAALGPAAFVVKGAKLTIWSLAPGARTWASGQVIRVPIQYGSSS